MYPTSKPIPVSWYLCYLGPMISSIYVPWNLWFLVPGWYPCSLGSMFPGIQFSQNKCSLVPMSPGTNVPQGLCSLGPVFPSTCVSWCLCFLAPIHVPQNLYFPVNFPSTYVSHFLCSWYLCFQVPMFPRIYDPQYLCSPVPVSQYLWSLVPVIYVPQYLCYPVPMFPSTYVL